MFYLLTAIFTVMALFSLFPFKDEKRFLSLFVLLLIPFTGFRDSGFTADYQTYIEIFHHPDYSIEISFRLVSAFIKTFLYSETVWLFVIYACIGLSLKYWAVVRISSFPLISFVLFIGYYFIIHDLTQIRAAVASGFLLLSVKPLYERNLFRFSVCAGLAVLFHYSALVLFFIYPLNTRQLNKRLYASLIAVAYLLYFLNIDLLGMIISVVPIDYLQQRYEGYKEFQNSGFGHFDKINVFNALFLLRVLVYYVLIWKSDFLAKRNPYFYIMLKIYAFSLLAFILFANSPVFAFRISELLGIVEICLFPVLIYLFRPPFFGRLTLVSYSFLCFYIQVFYNHYLVV